MTRRAYIYIRILFFKEYNSYKNINLKNHDK